MLTLRKTNNKQWYDWAIIALLVILFCLLPSVSSNELIQGTMSGKMFFFLYVILIGGILIALKFITKSSFCVSFSYIDGILFLWIAYILINGWFQHIPLSNRLLELSGLVVLYILLRQIEPSKFGIILIAMVLGCIIQSVYGNLQLWGYTPSNHSLFKMTGSFFNPGPFGGYLASVFPIMIGGLLFNKKYLLPLGEIGNLIILWVGVSLVLLTLVAADSRAAWLSIALSSMVLLVKRYSIIQLFRTGTSIKRNVLLLSLFVLVGVCFIGLMKPNDKSANGRLLIWKVSSGLFMQHPLIGVGFDRFKTFYMDEQADYFKNTLNSSEAMVAGDTNYCFNEFIQHAVENGVIGLFFMAGVLVCICAATSNLFNNELWIAKAGITGIIVFAFFSYPAQILPIKTGLVCYLAYIADCTEKKKVGFPKKDEYVFKPILAIFAVGVIFIGCTSLPAYYIACKNWNSAYQFTQLKDYTASMNASTKAWPLLRYNGDFLTHYGKTLTMAGEYKQAVEVLNQAVSFYPNIIVYTALGDNYKILGRIEDAERAYLKAWYMNPSRFYPKYLLAKLYDETNQSEKAITVAKELLDKEVKIESTAVREIQTEMKNILKKHKERG